MNNDKPFTDPQLDGHERFRVSQRNFGVSSDTAKIPNESAVESPNESLLTPCIDIKKTISRLKEFKDSYRDEYDDFHEA
jgi:hypothetical protein